MDELIKNTVLLVEDFNRDVKSDLSTKGIDNTGNAANSLRVNVERNGNRINIQSIGVDYFYYLDQGRGPGKFPPVDTIENWVINKPVPIDPFLVGRKIAREGTEIFKNKSKGIMLQEKREELLRKLKADAPRWAKQDILTKIKTFPKI